MYTASIQLRLCESLGFIYMMYNASCGHEYKNLFTTFIYYYSHPLIFREDQGTTEMNATISYGFIVQLLSVGFQKSTKS